MEAARAAAWVALHGAQHSARAPTIKERSRVTGAAAYLGNLGLDDRALYDAREGPCQQARSGPP
eukprot:7502978-Lingulodinium_polyedra.AAC.1